jgi:hypothetical protein
MSASRIQFTFRVSGKFYPQQLIANVWSSAAHSSPGANGNGCLVAIPEASRLGFRQQAHHVAIDIEKLEIDIRDIQLPGQRAGNLFLGDKAVFHKHPTQLAATAFLIG